jgi:hypothetical protein
MIATAAAARTQPAWTGRARQPAVPQQRCVSGGREPLAAVPSESMSGGPPVLRAEPCITGGAEPLYRQAGQAGLSGQLLAQCRVESISSPGSVNASCVRSRPGQPGPA